MQNNNRKLDFDRVSEVLKSRLVINKSMDIINQEVSQHADEGEAGNDALFYYDDSNDDYLFGDNQVNTTSNKRQRPKQLSEISKPLSQDAQQRPNEEERPVIKRKVSRAASQPNQIKKPPKPKYKKKDNVGNEIVRKQKIQAIFRKICEPNRTITVNSLGHALQRFKIKFQLKDIVEMLTLYQDMTNPQRAVSDQEDKQQELDLNVKMTENQFKEFFQMIRKKPKE